MKMIPIFSLVCAGLWLVPGAGISQAREPIHDLSDLSKLESKVEDVSKKVMPATVALIAEANGSSGSGVTSSSEVIARCPAMSAGVMLIGFQSSPPSSSKGRCKESAKNTVVAKRRSAQ